jgi:DNA-binding MarR family transcriptional regulator
MAASKRETARLTRIQHALGVVSRRAKDGALHERLGLRVGYLLEGPYYSTLARLRLIEGCTVSELAAGLGMEVSTVSRRINTLEERGLVERESGTVDRRTAHPRLTPEGAEVARILEHGWRDMLAEVTAEWSPTDLDTFATLFERFATDFENYAVDVTSRQTVRAPQQTTASRRK